MTIDGVEFVAVASGMFEHRQIAVIQIRRQVFQHIDTGQVVQRGWRYLPATKSQWPNGAYGVLR
jgi:hypothetical protein